MIETKFVEQKDRRLGRQMVHDSRSRAFASLVPVDRSTWRTKSIRIYDPIPNPNQPNGCCTACAKAMQLNAIGNRRKGRVLDMDFAQILYVWETQNDPFPGQMPEEDTGSNGLASCKGAIYFNEGGAYDWYFGGADEVVQAIMGGKVPSLGTWWPYGLFNPDAENVVHPTGSMAGGHQYVARGYDVRKDRVLIRCWWGTGYRDVWIARQDLDDLLRNDGDAHWQATL